MMLGVHPHLSPGMPNSFSHVLVKHLDQFPAYDCSVMLIYVTDVASWASPRHEHSEAERERLCARLKLMEAARAANL